MLLKKNGALISLLFLMTFLFMCSGCGLAAPQLPKGSKPDSVRVEITHPWVNSVVSIDDTKVVQQLYTKLYALSELGNRPCTTEGGPVYILTFNQGGKQLTIATVARSGCGTVSIQGESQVRSLTSEFWSFLAQSTTKAMTPIHMLRLAIQPISRTVQSTALLTSATATQNLYTNILALPHKLADYGCQNGFHPTYQLIFYAKNQIIPAQIDGTICNAIVLSPIFSDTAYFMDEPFKEFLKQTLAKVHFAPAKPDTLLVTLNNKSVEVHDITLIQSFYKKVVTLQLSVQRNGGCSSDTGGKYYTFHFLQWGLPLQVLFTSETSNCKGITSILTHIPENLQGDPEFWNFVHRATT